MMAQSTLATRASKRARNAQLERVRRRRNRMMLIFAVIIALAVGAVTWQVGEHRNSTHDVDKVAASARGPAVAAFTQVPESAFASQPPFTGPAVRTYGQPALQAGYRQLVNFAFRTGWDTTLMYKRHAALTTVDFAGIRRSLTASCAAAFDSRVSRALANKKAAVRALEGAAFFAVAGPGGAKPLRGAASVTNRSFTRAKVAMDKSHGRARLSMSFTVRALVHLQDAVGKRYVVQTGRAIRYLLVPNRGAGAGARPFLIDAWANHMQTKSPQAG